MPEIFEQALDMSPTEQQAYLDNACHAQPDLRKKIESLLDNDRYGHRSAHKKPPATPAPAGKVPFKMVVTEPTGALYGVAVGSYRIREKLGEGGMGVVYKAEHEHLKRPAVVKVLKRELADHPEIAQRFRHEAHLASSIRHPGIVDVFDVGQLDNSNLYILMEYLEGETLKRRLRKQGKLPETTAVSFVQQAARALAAAHNCGIVHRDLKPDNLFLVADGDVVGGERVKLLDFGIAKAMADRGEQATQPGIIMGTPAYMSPE
ncbi:MAG: serine/threonine-protein kinase, partial [Myxococcota bacterium]